MRDHLVLAARSRRGINFFPLLITLSFVMLIIIVSGKMSNQRTRTRHLLVL